MICFTSILAGGLLLASCGAHPTHEPAPKPPCTTDVVRINYDAETNCDLHRPQTLVLDLPNASDYYLHFCDDVGGQILLLDDRTLCMNVDY